MFKTILALQLSPYHQYILDCFAISSISIFRDENSLVNQLEVVTGVPSGSLTDSVSAVSEIEPRKHFSSSSLMLNELTLFLAGTAEVVKLLNN